MSPWGFGRRGVRPTEITWMPEDIELAPEWLQDEIGREPQELRDWLGVQDSQPKMGAAVSTTRVGRRGRRPKHR